MVFLRNHWFILFLKEKICRFCARMCPSPFYGAGMLEVTMKNSSAVATSHCVLAS